MTPEASERPPRSANHEVLEVRDELAKSVIEVCRHVTEMGRAAIEFRLFEDGNS